MIYSPRFSHLHGIDRKRIEPTPPDHLRLHRLERPEPWQAELHDAMFHVQPTPCHYPDYAAFYDRLSAFVGVPADQIVVGQGIEGLIRDLVMLTCEPGDAMAFTAPTCAMFGLYAQIFGARAVPIKMYPDGYNAADRVAYALPDDTRLLILPNPGQPVESCYGLDELRIITERCNYLGAVLAIDEAYYGFGAPTALPLIDEYDNVVVLRTFSKAFGGAALRIGFAMGSPAAIKPLEACRQSGEVAGPSMHAATVLMDMWESHVRLGIAQVIAGRNWLRDQLRDDGFNARGEHANHVLIDMGEAETARTATERLWASGVRVKGGFDAPVDRHLLVTCGSEGLMNRFYGAFRGAL